METITIQEQITEAFNNKVKNKNKITDINFITMEFIMSNKNNIKLKVLNNNNKMMVNHKKMKMNNLIKKINLRKFTQKVVQEDEEDLVETEHIITIIIQQDQYEMLDVDHQMFKLKNFNMISNNNIIGYVRENPNKINKMLKYKKCYKINKNNQENK